ncbi:cellulase N-terminal Ig-like domain-containing protein [Sinobaca sp. H24]|uniref:cellulase N-terminal Ig-like domain-containing protein n=1 Tax=Sinobaca sp. H24 TaxID=2923376 RepID=UPI00207AC067|nr:cellulase N-terminal Ig-like domain-containing protein [Sinobaca sp. H24]
MKKRILLTTVGTCLLFSGTAPNVLAEESDFNPPEYSDPIKVNQVGYLPEGKKVATILADPTYENFIIRNIDTKEIVFEGDLSEEEYDENSGDTVRKADFSALTTTGEYMRQAIQTPLILLRLEKTYTSSS